MCAVNFIAVVVFDAITVSVHTCVDSIDAAVAASADVVVDRRHTRQMLPALR